MNNNILGRRVAEELHGKFCANCKCPEGNCPWQIEEALVASGETSSDVWEFSAHTRFYNHAQDLISIFLKRLEEVSEEFDSLLRAIPR